MSAWKRQKTTGLRNSLVAVRSSGIPSCRGEMNKVRWGPVDGRFSQTSSPSRYPPPGSRKDAHLFEKLQSYWAYIFTHRGTESVGGGHVTNEITRQTRPPSCFPRLCAQKYTPNSSETVTPSSEPRAPCGRAAPRIPVGWGSCLQLSGVLPFDP